MERIRLLDLARGFTVLFIPAIHTGMLYSDFSIHDTLLGYCLIGIAEGPGAQLLMLLMGVSFTLKARHDTLTVAIRSMGLLIAGYGLNALKFVVPYSLGVLPEAVVRELDITGNGAVWQLIRIGDILHFAALALLVLQGVHRLKKYHVRALLLATMVLLASPWVWDTRCPIQWIDGVWQLFTGQPPRVFFPLFPWLVYPLIGLTIGYYVQKDQESTLARCGSIGGTLTLAGLLWEQVNPVINSAGFYRTPPVATLWHLGIVLVSLYAWHGIYTHVRDNGFFRLLAWSSRNITPLYIIQWVMICWLLSVFGFRELDTVMSVIVMTGMTVNTYLIHYIFQLLKQYYYGRSKNL